MKKIFAISFVLFACSAFAQSKLETPTEKVQTEQIGKLDEVVVTAKQPTQFDTIGEYNQPVWTTTRMFSSTRAYVMTPKDNVKYERWFEFRNRKNGEPTQVRMRDELAFGLGNRWELDLYNHTRYDGTSQNQTFEQKGFSYEFRYALADWGKIPGNPTLYFEHKLFDGRQGIEPKLLLSDRIGNTDWIWATNFIWEQNLGGGTAEDKEKEFAVTGSIGKVINDRLMVGLSTHTRKYYYQADNCNRCTEFYIGPAVNLKITNRARLSFEHMQAASSESVYNSRSFLIFAYDLN